MKCLSLPALHIIHQGENFVFGCQWQHQGGHGGHLPPVGGLPPHLPPIRRKNGQNQPFLANFLIFAPSETHFAPSIPPTKKKKFWCFHCRLQHESAFPQRDFARIVQTVNCTHQCHGAVALPLYQVHGSMVFFKNLLCFSHRYN